MNSRSVAIVACFRNRRLLTERMVRDLANQGGAAFRLRFFLTDDGSDDGTAEGLATLNVDATIVSGGGNLYWAGGMAIAIKQALASNPDLVLLVNDDVDFAEDVLSRMVACIDANGSTEPQIVVGSTCDENGGNTTYGGFIVDRGVGVRLRRVEPPTETPVEIDTFNANCVLMRAETLRDLGGISPGFSHALADLDLGLRARALGLKILLVPGYIGICKSHGRDLADASGLRELVLAVRHPKGLPPVPWALFNRRHGGPLWPIAFVGAYVKIVYRYFALQATGRL